METLEQLKSRAYDLIANIEYLKRELDATNKLIADYKPEEKTNE